MRHRRDLQRLLSCAEAMSPAGGAAPQWAVVDAASFATVRVALPPGSAVRCEVRAPASPTSREDIGALARALDLS